MNILSITYEYPPIGGGGAAVASALNSQLAALGHRVRVVTSGMSDLPVKESVAGVEIHRAFCLRDFRHYTTTAELLTSLVPAYQLAAKLIASERPDVIHVHFALPSGIVACQLAKRFKIPYVLTVHGSDIPGYNPDRFKWGHKIAALLWKRVVRRAAVVTSPSYFLAGLLREQSQIPVHIVRNGYDAAPKQRRTRRKLVLAVARLFPRKGIQHFLQAVSGLPSDWEFVVVGDGPYMSVLEAQAAALGSRVRFTGHLEKNAVLGLYEEASIFVFPSIQENFPMVLLEAMDAGCAVITTDAEGCAEVVGNAGIIVEKSSPDEIRQALIQLMASESLRQRMSELAAERVKLFRWKHIADQFVDVFQAALVGRVPRIQNLGGALFPEDQSTSATRRRASDRQRPAFAEAPRDTAIVSRPMTEFQHDVPLATFSSPRWDIGDILEYTHDAIIIWEMDGVGIVYWNRAAEQLYGYSRHEARGRTTHVLLNTHIDGGVDQLEGKLARYGVWVGDLRHRRRDGASVIVQARLALMSQNDGRWLVLEVNRDITSSDRLDERSQSRMEAHIATLNTPDTN